MGTWSAGSFGNDDALDYVDGLPSFDAAIETLMAFSSQPENLAVGDACVALGASDLLAAGLGRPPADLPEAKHISLRPVSEDVLEQARTLIDHVRTTSELAELWEDDAEEWHEALDALVVRLTPSAPYAPEDLTENGDVLPAARRRMMLEIGYKESDLTEDGHLKPKEF